MKRLQRKLLNSSPLSRAEHVGFGFPDSSLSLRPEHYASALGFITYLRYNAVKCLQSIFCVCKVFIN